MKKRRLVLALSSLTIALGGVAMMGAPVTAEVPRCSLRQVKYVKDVIRNECGDWGGRAYVRCSGYSIEFAGVVCNVR